MKGAKNRVGRSVHAISSGRHRRLYRPGIGGDVVLPGVVFNDCVDAAHDIDSVDAVVAHGRAETRRGHWRPSRPRVRRNVIDERVVKHIDRRARDIDAAEHVDLGADHDHGVVIANADADRYGHWGQGGPGIRGWIPPAERCRPDTAVVQAPGGIQHLVRCILAAHLGHRAGQIRRLECPALLRANLFRRRRRFTGRARWFCSQARHRDERVVRPRD